MMVIENGKTLRFCLYFSSKATVMYAGMVLGGIFSTQPNIQDKVFCGTSERFQPLTIFPKSSSQMLDWILNVRLVLFTDLH